MEPQDIAQTIADALDAYGEPFADAAVVDDDVLVNINGEPISLKVSPL